VARRQTRVYLIWIDERGAEQPQGFTCASANSSENAHHQPWFSFFVGRTEHFTCHYQGVSHAEWAETRTGIHVNRDRQLHLLPAQAVVIERHPPGPKGSHNAQRTMNDIWSSPVLKP